MAPYGRPGRPPCGDEPYKWKRETNTFWADFNLMKGEELMKLEYIPTEFIKDPLNRHYDDRRGWLAWHHVEPRPPRAHERLSRLLVRLGRWLEGERPS